MIFEILPDVKSCFGYVPLRLAVVFIGIFFILMQFFIEYVDYWIRTCYDSTREEECPYAESLSNFQYLEIAESFVQFFPSVFLLVAVYIKHRMLISMFLYLSLVCMLIDVTIDLTALTINIISPECRTTDVVLAIGCITYQTLLYMFIFYLLIVVKSYRSTIISIQSNVQGRRGRYEESTSKDVENISKYGRLKVTRRNPNISNTKPRPLLLDANNTADTDNTSKYTAKSSKSVRTTEIEKEMEQSKEVKQVSETKEEEEEDKEENGEKKI
ncbi:uncharacterized protein LOC128676750 [Plodia interpunctella]|uniref:uncharacterized protein LOC128676750 n=1 Tax=Plodia interpunctella TaxID=58824 RepID=UPI002368BF4B|nr:uncharacterized protein LOC128676750 [Plodia interpunctella]